MFYSYYGRIQIQTANYVTCDTSPTYLAYCMRLSKTVSWLIAKSKEPRAHRGSLLTLIQLKRSR